MGSSWHFPGSTKNPVSVVTAPLPAHIPWLQDRSCLASVHHPGIETLLHICLLDSLEKWGRLLHHNPKAAEPVHYLHKAQGDNPQIDKGGHLCRTMGCLTQHQVSILPHFISQETSLFSSCKLKKQSLSVHNLALEPIHCSQDLYKDQEAHPTLMPKDGYISLEDGLVQGNSYIQAKEYGQGWCSYYRDWVLC